MFNLFKTKKKDRLFKVTYNRSSGLSWERTSNTLLIVAENTTDAVKKFYELAGYNVANISEFTEIKLDGLDGIQAVEESTDET